MVVVDVIDALVVSIESKVCGGGGERPDFDSAIETRGSEGVGVFRIDGKRHDVMRMALEHSETFPVLVPVP